ncbi:S8 family serine peptidase [Amaricoccus solimangrovi]|uniref:Peptidase S8 n=1 Tax=Amaricoccus solimangrovi TaxID=2589815 RepID=A0A501WPT1_9RHOB|nr:S8 family serine peptidase [Amaricoccus solimangrovi]TPE49247.1 peptidase S8 [Amaricoccus solimangrovi]
MPRPAILIKLAGAPEQGFAGLRLDTGARLTPLFGVPGGDPALAGVAPGRPRAWFRAEAPEGFMTPAAAWDAAHAAVRDGLGVADAAVLAAEPDLEQVWPGEPARAAFGAAGGPEGQKGAPFDLGPGFGWHLDDAHSGLRAAREAVGAAGAGITIVHLDTGYDPAHRALPRNLDTARARNFVEGTNSAVDMAPASGVLTNRGHGTGTIGLLAGGDTRGLRSDPAIPNGFGPLGGAPEARVVPVRIANSVVHFWTSTVARGIDYARRIGADVVSMSMGGLPSASWADAVNAAYEAGVLIVCAAGNSFNGLPTSLIVYPARFNRVLAACGVMAKGNPYHGLGGPMEGCAGPMSKMRTAMAAYTPNAPWARIGSPDVIDMDGAGTSAATPQLAAAAALWLARHGDKYQRSWQRVEAARSALYHSAGRAGDAPDGTVDPLLGRGLLRARAALDMRPSAASLTRTAPDSASHAFLRLATSAFGAAEPDPRRLAMLRLELSQLALATPAAARALADPDDPAAVGDALGRRRLLEAILDEGHPSAALRAGLGAALGRGALQPPKPRPPAPPSTAPETSSGPGVPGSGAKIPRRIVERKPTKRRLRIFATDPGDSRSLRRSFVNVATVEIPWEEKLEPGPVGEYLEVIDIDPASGVAYPPVDLDAGALLAQDGIAPSEGNPNFHQQMVYAVAMRTIRNFELALGRRALWADHNWRDDKGAWHTDFVRRLRIYPHALRERNAYYSPERVALLFGYFAETGSASQSRNTVFSCLSHDIVAHETTHALLDGLHRRFKEPTSPDAFAFHEAFADIVAIFQHFTFPELLRYELRRLRGDLTRASILSDLARQFGQALHNGRALRQAIGDGPAGVFEDTGEAPAPAENYMDVSEPHRRGAILVAAIFEAFLAIFNRRTEDLLRLATSGTGVLGPGALPPDLIERLAREAVHVAQRILTSAIRALDYMPPVDPTFGDYLRAIVTADAEVSADSESGFRVAFAEAFARRGIYPSDVPIVSPDGLLWQGPAEPERWKGLRLFLRRAKVNLPDYNARDRSIVRRAAERAAVDLHDWLVRSLDAEMARSLGLDLALKIEVHSLRPAQRVTADGETRTDLVAVITQKKRLPRDPADPDGPSFTFRGGCVLILDREYDADCPIRYAISRPIFNESRARRVREYQFGGGVTDAYGDAATAFEGGARSRAEPFALVHAELGRE